MTNYVDGSASLTASENTEAEAQRVRNNRSTIDASFGINQDDADKETITIRICSSDSD